MIANTVIKKCSTQWCSALKNVVRLSSSVAAQSVPLADEGGSSQPLPFFRTSESRPAYHTKQQIGQFYTVNPNTRKQLFLHGGIPREHNTQIETFNEMSLMVREPALEVISYLKAANYSNPTIRYAFFGRMGCGKSLSLAHVLHYGHEAGFVLVHVPWVPYWFRFPKECADSVTKEGFVDLPLDAAAWLIHFKTQNAAILNELQLTVSDDYVWSKRETTPKGSSLLDLVDLGIARIKFASDCISAVLKELKQHSDLGRCKTLVALDGFNALFYPSTKVRMADRTFVPPSKVSFIDAFLDLTKFDWRHGAVVLTIDELAVGKEMNESFLPRYQLGKEGFEHLDPFIPVNVLPYTEKELESCIAYYADRKWICNPKGNTEEGRKELGFLSVMNPYQLMRICASL